MSNSREILMILLAITLVFVGVVLAGEISNPLEPSPLAAPYTLEDVYQKLTDPDYTTNPTHFLYPIVSTSTETMHSLGDIYGAIPTYKTLDGSTTTVEAGIYATTTLADILGSGLSPENIASGTVIFGITGTNDCTPPNQ